jgi:hypothetical protein
MYQETLTEGEGSVQLTSSTNWFRSVASDIANFINFLTNTEVNCTQPSFLVSVLWLYP